MITYNIFRFLWLDLTINTTIGQKRFGLLLYRHNPGFQIVLMDIFLLKPTRCQYLIPIEQHLFLCRPHPQFVSPHVMFSYFDRESIPPSFPFNLSRTPPQHNIYTCNLIHNFM